MSNIYKLKKQASQTKLVPVHGKGTCFHEGNLDSIQTKVGMDGEDECWETVAEIWPSSPKSQSKADAILLAVGFNFILEALEGLKDAREFACRWDEMDDEEIKFSKRLSALIDKIENCKI